MQAHNPCQRVLGQRPGTGWWLPPGDGVVVAALVADGDIQPAEVSGYGVADVSDYALRTNGGQDSVADCVGQGHAGQAVKFLFCFAQVGGQQRGGLVGVGRRR